MSMSCVCLCVSVCLSFREDISETTLAIFTKFLCMLPMAVSLSSSGVVAIRYVLPVLWMTSYFFYNRPYSGTNFATKDRSIQLKIYLFAVNTDIIQFPIIQGHDFD